MSACHDLGERVPLAQILARIIDTDNPTDTFVRGISDWFTPQNYAGESDAVDLAYRDLAGGTRDNRTFHVYGYSLALRPGKTVQSIRLPSNGNVVLLAMSLV